MEWADSLSVGVKEIDDRHKELINRVNAFSGAMKNGNANGQAMEVLSFLEACVVTHFKDEEALRITYNYPNYKVHRQIHKGFVRKVKEMHASVEKGPASAAALMVGATLASWMLLHINRKDKSTGAYIRDKNVN
jgi:hemerythrin